jgi:hypothetical protein
MIRKTNKYKQRAYKSIYKNNKTEKNNKKIFGGNFKTVHQIWFGSKEIPEWRKYLFDKNKQISHNAGYKYKLWTEEDRTKKNFPITYPYQETCLIKGEEIKQNRFAQVADLARIEIIYKNGGVYIDSIIEISDYFLNEITRLFNNGYEFIGANEDPCGLDCVGNEGRNYLSNSFFASNKNNIILERLLDYEKLDDIDLESEYINRTTGPYYLREGIINPFAEKLFLFETNQVYPFNINDTEYRTRNINICLTKSNEENTIEVSKDKFLKIDCLNKLIKYKKNILDEVAEKKRLIDKLEDEIKKSGYYDIPLCIYHSGLGGSWSW